MPDSSASSRGSLGSRPYNVKSRKKGITMCQNCYFGNDWDSCSLTIAATMSVDSTLRRPAGTSPADANQLPGGGHSFRRGGHIAALFNLAVARAP